MKKLLMALFLSVPFAAGVAQQEIDLGEIIVTPLKTSSSLRSQQGNALVIDDEYIYERNISFIADALNLSEGLNVVGGGAYQSASLGIYLRGAQPRHTAYMFDGLKIYDPANPSAYYVPYDLTVTGAQRIEIVKFALSSLYGSSPLAGVINIIPKKPQGKPYFVLTTGGGSHKTSQENLELGGKIDNFSYFFNVNRLDTEGFSRSRRDNNNPENDAYQNTDITLTFNYLVPDDIEAGFSAKAIHSRSELDDDDNFDGLPEDDLDYLAWNNEFFPTVYIRKQLTEMLAYKVQGGFTSIYRKYRDGFEDDMQGWYKGETYQCNTHFEISPAEFTKTIVGFDYTREKMDNYLFVNGFASDAAKTTGRSQGYFIEEIFTPAEGLSLDFSYRRERHPYFKDPSIKKVGITYSFCKNSDFYFSYGEGFKSPSLYQLFDVWRGNTALQPEKSRSWSAGVNQRFSENLSLKCGYFHSDFKNLIDFVLTDHFLWTGSFLNAAKAKSRGVEASFEFKPFDALSLAAGYTYLRGEQDFVDTDYITIFKHCLIRVPKHKAFLKIGWQSERFKSFFDLQYVGQRFDRIWVGAWPVDDVFVKMNPYVLGNLSFEYAVNNKASVYVKINNIFNRNYENLKGFQEDTVSVYGGIKINF